MDVQSAAFVGAVTLFGILRVLIVSAVVLGLGWLIGLLLRNVTGVRYLGRLMLVAPWVTALYVLLGIVIGALTVAEQASAGPLSFTISRVEDFLAPLMYLLWLLAGLGWPARRRWRRSRVQPGSIALG
ncbi:MAG: hypothetical protein KGJ86_09165 [Chloroflexota bacterium]|nr:hypothetical protein [Chloroflexota bacterium]